MAQMRSEVTQQNILLSAAKVIDERNYERAALVEIAEQAGVTTGAFYFHFKNKEELAHAVIEAQNEYSQQRAERILAMDVPAMEKILAVSADFTRSIIENQLVRAGIRLTTEVNMFSEPPQLPWNQWTALSVELWTQAVREGDIKEDIDVSAHAEFVTAAYAGVQLLSGLMTARKDLPQRIFNMWAILIGEATPSERTEHWTNRARELFLTAQ
jgi:AcrR family transcriptional regulator